MQVRSPKRSLAATDKVSTARADRTMPLAGVPPEVEVNQRPAWH
jgi:hypothetical protein